MRIRKKAFILLSSLLILVFFSFLSINIIQNKSYSSKINTLKYIELQAEIHMKYIKKQLKFGIKSSDITINDSRYKLNITTINNKQFNIYINHTTEHIRIYDSLSLK